MSKDIPIIFSGPMVRALLEGRKTMTRRILKPQPEPFLIDEKPCGVGLLHVEGDPRPRVTLGRVITKQEVCYAAGDRLWVRENWLQFDPDHVIAGQQYAFGADTLPGSEGDDCRKQYGYKWRPSIHMPRVASRLTLVVTGVKVERVKEISDADAIAEGVSAWRAAWTAKEAACAFLRGTEAACETSHGTAAQRLFYLLWTAINGEEAWKQNPFVVAVSFRVIKANIDTPEARIAA